MASILLIDDFFNWIEQKSKQAYYVYYLTFVLVCLSLFFATPKYLFYLHNPELVAETWNTFVLKSKNLLDPLTHLNPNTHHAKLVYRLTVPVIIKIFGLNYAGAYALKFLIGILLLIQIYRLSYKLISNSASATFVTAGLAFLYFGRASFVAYPTFDGIAFFCAVLAMLYQRPILIFFLCTVTAWVDERALSAMPIILLFHQMRSGKSSEIGWKKLAALNFSSIAIVAAAAVYTAFRLLLTFQFGMYTPTASADFSVIPYNIHLLGFGIWTFYEGFWLLYLLAILYALKNKNYFLLTTILAQTFVLGLLAACVGDVTRSGSYLVPLVFVFISYLKNHLNAYHMKFILFICAVISFIFPSYYMIAKSVDMQHPIYYDVIAFILSRVG